MNSWQDLDDDRPLGVLYRDASPSKWGVHTMNHGVRLGGMLCALELQQAGFWRALLDEAPLANGADGDRLDVAPANAEEAYRRPA